MPLGRSAMADHRRRMMQDASAGGGGGGGASSEASIEVPSSLSIARRNDDDDGQPLDRSDLTLSRSVAMTGPDGATSSRRLSSVTSFGSNEEDDSDSNAGGDHDGDDSSSGVSGDESSNSRNNPKDYSNSSSAEFSYGSTGGMAHTGPRRQRRASFSLKLPPTGIGLGTSELDLIGEDDSVDHGIAENMASASASNLMGGGSASPLPPSGRAALGGGVAGGSGRRKFSVAPRMARQSISIRSAPSGSIGQGIGGEGGGPPSMLSQSMAVGSMSGGTVELGSSSSLGQGGGGGSGKAPFKSIRSTFIGRSRQSAIPGIGGAGIGIPGGKSRSAGSGTSGKSAASSGGGGSGSSRGGVGGGDRQRISINAETALATLGNADANASAWESVAAAAALVASEAEAAKSSSAKHHRRYGVGDHVLVNLGVLNATLGGNYLGRRSEGGGELPMADEEGEALASERIQALKDSSTLVPVNRFGYPPGGTPQGASAAEQRGPYGHVLCTVARVHFDEDALYYTVTRADTGTDQRADAEWMEPVLSEEAYAAALFAAQTTRESTERQRKKKVKKRNTFADVSFWFRTVVWVRAVGWYHRARLFCKVQATQCLYGSEPYGCRLQFSGVNFLVLCSFVFMFGDQARLAFTAASADFGLLIAGAVVWSILAIELLWEVLLRPSGYSVLITSEKAYAPSTARFINGFHLFFEVMTLVLYIPNFRALATGDYGAAFPFSTMQASYSSVFGPTQKDSFLGHLYFATLRFRIFNLVRHWKRMWIDHTFDESVERSNVIKGYWVPEGNKVEQVKKSIRIANAHNEKNEKMNGSQLSIDTDDYDREAEEEKAAKERRRQARRDDKRLNKAATIGTALMVVNSHRAMILIVAIVGILPLIYSVMRGTVNTSNINSVEILQQNNVLVPGNDTESCEYLDSTVAAWVTSLVRVRVNSNDYASAQRAETLLLWAQVLPPRCSWSDNEGVITECQGDGPGAPEFCDEWNTNVNADQISSEYFAETLNLRTGVVATYSFSEKVVVNGTETVFQATAIFNEGHSIAYVNYASVCLQACLLVIILLGLTVLRGDAGQLVLDPLRRMLKIVLRYAANPLSQTVTSRKQRSRIVSDDDATVDSDSDVEHAEKDQLGNYETEQLISAIAKITDLLRKCWGVAGAGIISSNLARTTDGKTVVFNPTVAGKRVYALFGFAGINDFGHLLRSLDQDVMILINDIAKIVHEEVYRWGLGDSGQCNKNLGAAFLMVYRIGDFKEVQEKKARATEVIFTSSAKQTRKSQVNKSRRQGSYGKRSRRRAKELDTLQLASLPGIQAFTDRALLGMLKSFAGIYRDRALLKWTKDFRLGAGVDAFSLGLIFGMDAGWGVEGAVGSEYKIDATYLSPHVNMASRMMSACKQYGVSVLLSQAVEKLLSEQARAKLRHIDTVTVKGSTLKQQIFTYDAQHRGVDFFLYERSAKQADIDSDSYNPKIWETDQDLKAMRQHISDDFEEAFSEGRKAYLLGKWDVASDRLAEADRIMITRRVEEGYMEYESRGYANQLLKPESPKDDEEVVRLRSEFGDGPCRCLLSYIKKEGGVAPKNWRGVRPLTSK